MDDRIDSQGILLKNIKEKLKELEKLLNDINSHWKYEDSVYRFYHRSFKVFNVQNITTEVVSFLKELTPPSGSINSYFEQIFKEGTGKIFDPSQKKNWILTTRPIIEAFFHAKYFLEMAFKYGSELDQAPISLPSGWAALLHFYNIR